ncbi:TetR/AcrR family transcriptional regulator [Rhodococcus koreensis]
MRTRGRATSTRQPGRAGSGRETILRAAVENFQRRGYHGTSIRDIARDADITPASIYHHFPSKQRILQEIMEEVLNEVISLTHAAVVRAGPSPVGQLEALMQAWVLYHTNNRAEALIGASEIRSLDEVGHRIVVALRDRQQQLFRDIIERGVSEGEFVTPYPREAARAIINMGYSIASWYRPGGELTPEELADRYVVLALGAVGADAVAAAAATTPRRSSHQYP